jgi:hypothetical protein
MMVFGNLPKDIVLLILKYDGRIKYRDGRYINAIPTWDQRYKLLAELPFPKPVLYTMTYERLFEEHFEYKLVFKERKYEMLVWNIYNPPDKVMYYLYKPFDGRYKELWHRM